MKCPKCGFNTFEYYDSCNKCSSDLKPYKHSYGITPLVIPSEGKQKMAAAFRSAESSVVQVHEAPETYDDIFSFDLPEASPPEAEASRHNPFSFDEPAADMNQSNSQKSSDDIFADLLESTAHVGKQTVSAPAKQEFSSGTGEFDFENFSWDDTPSSPPAADSKKNDDNLDSLFIITGKTPPK